MRRTKIIFPLMGETLSGMAKECEIGKSFHPDFFELRLDCLNDLSSLPFLIESIKKKSEGKELILTLRTKDEGGYFTKSRDEYYLLLKKFLDLPFPFLLDVEWDLEEEKLEKVVYLAKEKKIPLLFSKHFIKHTPPMEEMIHILLSMYRKGATVCKLATWPKEEEDVWNLLFASRKAKELQEDICLLTISMGALGRISRVATSLSHSFATFAGSHLGQIKGEELARILELLEGSGNENECDAAFGDQRYRLPRT